MFNKSTILITGGTGSFGQEFVQRTLRKYSPQKIIIYSRDEMKQWEMAKKFGKDSRLRYFIGDVRDKDRLSRAFDGVDYVVHAAAIKIVPSAEYNPFECIKTNVQGAMNVIDCALDHHVKRVVALSTDKACNPINLYGATKLCSDKLFVAANAYTGGRDLRFSIVRYGNVMGSRGSIIPLFRSLAKSGDIPVTDERMTRFMITLQQGVELVWHALADCAGGEIYVKKIPSMKVVDIAKTIAPDAKITIVGIRAGEKLHEQMISEEDARSTVEYDSHYVILPQIDLLDGRFARYKDAKHCPEGFRYSSETNQWWLTPGELKVWIEQKFDRQEAHEDGRPLFDHVSSEALYETAITEVMEAMPEVGSEFFQMKTAVTHLKQKEDNAALDILASLAQSSSLPVAKLYLAKAVAEMRLGRYHDAFMSVSRLLREQEDNKMAKTLLRGIGEALGAQHVLDLS